MQVFNDFFSSSQFVLNGAHQGGNHSVSQEVSSTESEKDSHSQFHASTHSIEPEKDSASQSPANRRSPTTMDSSLSASDVD